MYITKTREKILRLFFDNPARHIHLRGIVRRTGVNPQNAHKYLRQFVEDGLLLKSDFTQFALYRINPKNAFIFKIFELFELEKKQKFYARNRALEPRLLNFMRVCRRLSRNTVRAVILHGPASRGEWTEGSQVDIMAVTADSTADCIADSTAGSTAGSPMSAILQETTASLRTMLTIYPTHHAMDAVIQGLRKKDPLFTALLKERVVLYNEFLFWQIIRESRSKTFDIGEFRW
jgi:hypothetical protein